MTADVRAIFPEGSAERADFLKLSPAVVSGDHVFLTGVTGSGPDGTMPPDPETQIRAAFEKIAEVLSATGLDWRAVVEMTSYHVALQEHFDIFASVRENYVSAPYPAWTAVEVAGLRRAAALVEIRVIARNGTAERTP